MRHVWDLANNGSISVSSLNHTLTENGTRDGMDHPRGSGLGLTISTAPITSPTTAAYPGPRPPYSSTSATLSSHSNYEYMSPPSSRRTTMDDKTQAPRQSLPSITEALKNDLPPFATSTSRALPPARPAEASITPGRTLPEPPPGPPNPFSQSTTSADRYNVRPSGSLDTLTGQDPNKSFQSINATAPLPPSTFRSTPKSPRSTTYPQYSPSYHPSPHTKDFGPPPNVSPRPPQQSPYSYSMNSAETPSALGPGSEPNRFSPPMKYENGRPPAPRAPLPPSSYGTAVKRHIDTYDAECALNQVL